MLINFFYGLRQAALPVTVRELLDLIEALDKKVVFADIDEFYFLARAIMVKDEKYFDRFDRAFGRYFENLESFEDLVDMLIPDEWLRKEFEKNLSDEEKAAIESLGGLEELIEQFKQRLAEQEEKHAGGNKWIGTGGTSPFGQDGYHPEGMRVGPNGKNKKAVKVWDKREFKNLDDSVELGTRNIKVALKRLRKFARTGASDELDLDKTISSTANNAGMLNIEMRPERHNAVKVLLFLDVGGSMDPFIRICEELFSAARTEFKHLEYFYFHNFTYDYVWKDNHRRHQERINTMDLIHKYGRDYKIIFIGDASMSPYEIVSVGGSVEYWNDESGEAWFSRIKNTFDNLIWLNPVGERHWEYTQSIEIVRHLVEDNMFPLTIAGLEQAMKALSRA